MRRPDKTKYTILVDQQIQDYQLHLKRNTNVNFSDLVRVAVTRIASDPKLEAELFQSIGPDKGYYEDYEPATPPAAPAAPVAALPPPPQPEAPSPQADDDGGEFWSPGQG